MPRAKKYHSEQEKREANRISAKAYHERNKACINAKRQETHAQKRAKVLEYLARNERKQWGMTVREAQPIPKNATNVEHELMQRAIQYHLDRLEKINESLKEQQSVVLSTSGGDTAAQKIEQMLVEIREVLLWVDEVEEYAAKGGAVLVKMVRENRMMFQEEP
ncbi:hypothetical protein FA15DRAFT_710735 [Coprinopsis marcescibilis]|uniref:Uncharacterized protein n=1 Tax=Coprinopsis marcescibilis TaxID=230819 RepID=A0A5C3KBR3_COPMA|nr:hypothetical protein FA15DRAFT_710735 [Coprinopsis marcescibilis]